MANESCGPTQASSEEVKPGTRSEEHTSELQSPCNLVCRLLLEKKKQKLLIAHAFFGSRYHQRCLNATSGFLLSLSYGGSIRPSRLRSLPPGGSRLRTAA